MQWIQSGCMLNPVLRPHQLWLMWSDCLHWAEPSSSSSWRQLTQGRAEHRHWSLLHWRKLKNRKILRHVLNGDNSFTSQWTHGSLFRMDISDNDLRKWIRSTSGQMNQSLVGSTCCLKAAAAPQQTNVFSHVTSGERTGVSAAGVSAGRIYRRVCVSAL